MNVYGLIGYPLGHSFSKQYFTEKFIREEIHGCRFELFELDEIGKLPALLQKEPCLKGLAVTIPYKESVMNLLDAVDKEAEAVGAVNCICITSGRLTGYNTDITGFEKSLQPLLKAHHTKALVLGSGGASKAVQYVLKKLGISFRVVTRHNDPAPGFINYLSINEQVIREHTLIINCTPVGMYPHALEEPGIPYKYINSEHLLYDLIYRPATTSFLIKGREQGALIKNGSEMLVLQAEENWKLWNGL